MIAFRSIPLKEFIKPHNPSSPHDLQIQKFQSHLQRLLEGSNASYQEKPQEQEIGDFLKEVFSYRCRSKDHIDLAILQDDEVRVIIEVKALNNQKELARENQIPLAKALYESILYFLREFNQGNNSIKHIILCNPCEFYIFDAKSFAIFQNDKKIRKFYKECDDKEGAITKTEVFYSQLQNYLENEFEGELPYTYFSLKEDDLDSKLPYLYQIFSPEVLLKKPKTLDANTLNKDFYDELLYLLGLKEIKSKDKILIIPSEIKNTLSFALQKAYPNLDKEEIFTLIITWNNRILFLTLLESMLLSFKHIDSAFLCLEAIPDFKALQTLFFEVLAKKPRERSSIKPIFQNIPYLNSSLFDKIPLEMEGKDIGLLDSLSLPLYSKSILKKTKAFKNKESLPLLEYLFAFLHTYDFTTTPQDISDGVKQNHDKLINSAVLGLVFEKLNGYKEGSFYTPSFITSYMCKEAITQALITKCNATYGWNISSLEEIFAEARRDKISNDSIFATFLSLRICDPAVGSGHFLVSALNTMIEIAYKLGFLNLPLNLTLEIENDEILIKQQNTIFSYTKPNSPQEISHKIQKEMFDLKRSIIENCLFGVDINPNSCEITKLRLWIELLKYSFYLFDEKGENTNDLETLPNIDINIKCGNSLISRFDLKDTLIQIPNIKHKIKDYKNLVQQYKDTTLEISKASLQAKIQDLKQTFALTLKDPKTKDELQKAIHNHITLYNDYLLDDESLFDGLESRERNLFGTPNLTPKEQEEAFISYGKIQALRKKLDIALSGEEYANAFEWRFEFPEVLDSEGNFLGFDCIIGNPPYGVKFTQEEREAYRNAFASSSSDTAQLFIFQADKLLTPKGINAFIVPKALTFASNWQQIRDFLKQDLTQVIDCGRAWSYVLLEMIIFIRHRQSFCDAYKTGFLNADSQIAQSFFVEKKYIELFRLYPNDLTPQEFDLGLKIRKAFTMSLGDCGENFRGENFQDVIQTRGTLRVYGGKEIQRYYIEGKKGFVSKNLKLNSKAKIQTNSVLMQRIIAHIENPVPHIKMTGTILKNTENLRIVDTVYQIVCHKDVSNFYILGLLHSTFLNWYCYRFVFAKAIRSFQFTAEVANRIPIPKITKQNQKIADKIITNVEQILKIKENDSQANTQSLESEIDSLVYELYSLTDEEISLIEK